MRYRWVEPRRPSLKSASALSADIETRGRSCYYLALMVRAKRKGRGASCRNLEGASMAKLYCLDKVNIHRKSPSVKYDAGMSIFTMIPPVDTWH